METKSRYEVIADLESKKRDLIREKEQLNRTSDELAVELKRLKRQLEDKQEDKEQYEASLEEKRAMLDALIKGVDDSLERMNTLLSQKK